jgi:hypothetical protein
MKRICLHGPESTGKSTHGTRVWRRILGARSCPNMAAPIARRMAPTSAWPNWSISHRQQDVMNRAAAARAAELEIGQVLFDTDPLITEVWAEMMFGQQRPVVRQLFKLCGSLSVARHRPALCRRWPARLRQPRTTPAHFFDLCKAELDRRGRALCAGTAAKGDARFNAALRGWITHPIPRPVRKFDGDIRLSRG